MRAGARRLLRGIAIAGLWGCAAGGGTWSAPWSAAPSPGDRVSEDLRRALDAAAESAPQAAVVPPPARRASASAPAVWLEVERPGGGEAARVRTGWMEVAGFAGARERRAYDVILVLDVSGSTQYASGADVDGDGVTGVRSKRIGTRVRDPRAYCSDPGDTVLDAERVATRRLLERLDPRRTRIGLVSFSDLARPRAPLGSSAELLDLVLDDLADDFGAGPTNLAAATRLATRMLRETGEAARAPDPVVLILSDGYPTHPRSEAHAAEEALSAAREAGDLGVRVSSFALGIDEPRDPDVFATMAELTGGQHVRVETPGDVLHALPGIDLAQVDRVDVRNLTSGEGARAPRLRPDGRFDAYVKLRPGANRLRITARGSEGAVAVAERVVHYDDALPPDPQEVARIQKAIELRTVEIELEREMRAVRAAQRKVLRVDGEEAPAD